VILDKVRRGKGNYGYDAAKGEYTDIIKASIPDPTKVVRTALLRNPALAGFLFASTRCRTALP